MKTYSGNEADIDCIVIKKWLKIIPTKGQKCFNHDEAMCSLVISRDFEI